jgi:RNA polymerase sigma-70 factor (ECF subfamily)
MTTVSRSERKAADRLGGQGLLDAAREGDEAAFVGLLAPYRSELQAHCYRMLGSAHDAEDAMQETLVRAWRSLGRFEGRSSLRSWLYRIATNACLRAIERRPQRILPIAYPGAEDGQAEIAERVLEPVWIEPFPDEDDGMSLPEARYARRESVELAFIAALQHLPARQRAVLVLRDVLGFSAREVSDMLDTSPASIDSVMARARRTVEQRLPPRSQQATLRAIGDRRLKQLVGAYVDAWEAGDLEAVVEMLTEDARMAMPPIPTWFAGRGAVAAFLARRAFHPDRARRLLPVRANGAVALAQYSGDRDGGELAAHALIVLGFREQKIAAIDAFLVPELFPRFGLPTELRLPA